MNKPVDDRLRRLGAGESIPSLCKTSGMSRQQFEDWWRDEIRSRVPEMEGRHELAVTRPVQIERDCWGIPHISAEDDQDLFFGYGFAMAQDRLFQLDYLRRKGQGRLAEILGPDGVESDLLVRTVGCRASRPQRKIASRQRRPRGSRPFRTGSTPAWSAAARLCPSNSISSAMSPSPGPPPTAWPFRSSSSGI